LNLRTTLGGATGRWLFRTEHTTLTAFGGLVYTNERYSTPPDPTQATSPEANNIEGLLGLEYSYVRWKSTTIRSRFTLFPSFTTAGRVRLNYAPTLNLEIAHNLYWSFTLYENYDTQPPVNANKNDFGVTNSIGWKF
jgi:putative salt-induced outer membrane protein